MDRRNIGIEGFSAPCNGGCEVCPLKFQCYTTRGTILFDAETVKLLHKLKAKAQGRYYPGEAGNPA